MQEVSDAFLLQIAEVAGGLFGLFMVGMLFYTAFLSLATLLLSVFDIEMSR